MEYCMYTIDIVTDRNESCFFEHDGTCIIFISLGTRNKHNQIISRHNIWLG